MTTDNPRSPWQCCANCMFRCEIAAQQFECRQQPPAVAAMPIITKPALVGPGGTPEVNWLVKSIWRPVKPNEWCGQYRVSPERGN